MNQHAIDIDRKTQLKDDIDESTKLIEQLNDGQQDLEVLMEDDACKIRIGECFLSVSNEDAEEHVEKLLEEEKSKLEELEKEMGELDDRMTQTKSKLYAKFGNTINLEENSENHLLDEKKK